MSRSTRHFLDLLDVELADVAADLREVEVVMRERLRTQSLTPYVFQQNAALLEREVEGINRLRSLLRSHPFDPDADLTVTAGSVREVIRREIGHLHLPQALSSLLERRIQKLLDYVDCCS
ncbi:MAG: hypothetical protein EA427_04690 [Spirochaetaceae bacterium]|nr:MAG: hypothetical protein EA427_04690 [Spirochaetaceae bacterium]